MLADSLDRLIAAHIAPDDIPGMALRICHKGETLYDRGFGFRDFEQKKPMGADTICRIYSMTKPVTAAAVMMLVERGKIDLAQPTPMCWALWWRRSQA